MWLRVKLTAAFAGCAVLPLALSVGALWIWGSQAQHDQATRELNEATQSLTASIEGRLAFDLAQLKTFGALPVMQDAMIGDSGHDVARAIAGLKAQSAEFIDLFVTDARGYVVAATSPNDLGRRATTDEGFRAAASGSIYQSGLIVRDAPAGAVISFTVPLIATYDKQSVIGTLSGTVDVGVIAEAAKAQSMLAPADNAMLVVRRQDSRIGFATHSDATIVAAAKGGADVITWRGASNFVTSAPSAGKGLVRDPGFVVRTVSPTAKAFAGIDTASLTAALVAIVGATAALALSWLWSTPLVTLGEAMERLMNGDVSARAPNIPHTHTFAPMARAFETLRQVKSVHEWLTGRERELARKKEQAEQALREKSEHMASLTRALKAQLATIVELSDAINTETLSALAGHTRASVAKDISRSGSQLLGVINDLFELSEAEAGHAMLTESEVDLTTLVHDCVDAARDTAKSAEIAISCNCPQFATVARIDAAKIKHALSNLISNAINFTPQGGRVEVTLAIDGAGRPSILVADTGIGMRPNLGPMATPFSEVADGKTHGRHGAGLGLPLARQYVHMHDGSFAIESEPGKGTVVAFALPVQRLVALGSTPVQLTAA